MGLYEQWPYVNFHELNLNWIVQQMGEIRKEYEEVKQLSNDLQDLKDKYTEIYALYGDLENDFNVFTNKITNDFSTYSLELDLKFEQQAQNMQDQFTILQSNVNAILGGFNTRLTQMDIKLDNALDNLADSIRMYNPFTGIDEPMSNVIYQLASFHMQDALTAGAYDAMALTAATYDAKALTAYQYDIEGSNYLP